MIQRKRVVKKAKAKLMKKNNQGFTCIHCNTKIPSASKGKCRNHCPNCFHSKHVDINPGDRKNLCKGVMEPKKIEKRGQNMYILHQCLKCGYKRWNKILEDDKINAVFLKLLDK